MCKSQSQQSQPRKMHAIEQSEENGRMFLGTAEVEMTAKPKHIEAVTADMDNDKVTD
jgi:hypothetical protein